MAGSPVRARFAPKTAQDYDRRAESSISNRRRGGAAEGVARADCEPMPEAPILILVAAPIPSSDVPDIARGPDGDPVILGLSLVQRAVLAARRAGYGRVLLLGRKIPPRPGSPPLPIGAASPQACLPLSRRR